MKILYPLFIVLFMTVGAFAKPSAKQGTINGTVLDEQNKPVEFATVGLFRSADSSLVKTALTAVDGKFKFQEIIAGSYYVKISNIGHRQYKSDVFTIAEGSLMVNLNTIKLIADSKTLNAVSIKGTKPLLERKADKMVMNVESSSIMIGSNALEVLQKAPGVTVDQNDNIAMQGRQGILILLDGKQTYMSNADVATLLKNMQSTEIETIELITNPSSKYDAAGNSGIINIKTKKGKNLGTNGSLNGTLAYGENFRENLGLSINNRSKKVNLFGNYNFNNGDREGVIFIDRIANGSPKTYFRQEGNMNNSFTNHNFKAGADFFVNSKNTIGVLVNGYINRGGENSFNNTLIGSSFQTVDSLLLSKTLQKSSYDNISYNLNYKTVLDTAGSELSVDLDYAKFDGNDAATYENDSQFPNGIMKRPISLIRNTTPSQIDIKAVKIDYNVALTKTLKLDVGAKSSWVKTDNDLQAEELVDNNWQNDIRRSNRFVYDENVNAAYANLNKQFKNTSIQVGLRMEQTNSTGNLITTSEVVDRSYWDFFPTTFIQHTLSKNNQIGFSYGRRIDRPRYDALNPFIYYLDQYTYNKGNPFLNPQYTHNFEATYTFKQMYFLTLTYSRTNDAITDVLLPDESIKALYQTNANVAKNITYGANLNVPIKFAKWWESNNNLNVFNLSFESPNLGGQALKTGKTSFQVRSQHTFILGNGFTAELMGNYESPLDYGVLSIKSRYFMDIGLSKSLMNKKANVRFALADVFDTNRNNLESNYSGLTYEVRQKNETRIARLSFTYRFGKNEIKPARRRATGTENEQNRLKN